MKISEIKDKTVVSGTYRVLFEFEVDKDKEIWLDGKKVKKDLQNIIVVDIDSQIGDMSAKVQLMDDNIGKFKKDDIIQLNNCWAIMWKRKDKEGNELPQPIIKEGKDGKYAKVQS